MSSEQNSYTFYTDYPEELPEFAYIQPDGIVLSTIGHNRDVIGRMVELGSLPELPASKKPKYTIYDVYAGTHPLIAPPQGPNRGWNHDH